MSRKDEMQCLIEEQASSGQSVKEFCQVKGIAPAKFFYWRKKLHPPPNQGGFVRVEVTPNEKLSCLEVIYPNGVRLRPGQADMTLLQQLIRLY